MAAFIPIIVLLVALIAYLAWKSHQRTIETWRSVAADLGLAASGGGGMSRPTLNGTIQGHPVTIDTYVVRSGNSSTTYTRYRVGYPRFGFDLTLKREGAFSAITKLFGQQDVEIGDELFDDAFLVKTSDPGRLKKLLTPSVRTGLLRLLASYGSAVVHQDHIIATRGRFESDAEVLKSTTQRLVATARLLASPDAGVTDEMVLDREQGLLDDVAGRIRERIETAPDDVDQRIFEVETLAASGHEDAAAERLAELERLAPADPDVVGWKEALQTERIPRSSSVDVDALAKDLFGGDDLSFETRSKFNAQYADAPVSWQGVVKKADPEQVIVTVANVHNDLYGNTDIDVVVENPTGGLVAVGEMVTVSGTLDTVDPLVRNLYLRGGVLGRR
ncbi:MAG: hypothetical protein QNJ77_00880 [Acidimicrobiia bacterium]|nr:hypothetical protein [Acidimicrobiia bacterium]